MCAVIWSRHSSTTHCSCLINAVCILHSKRRCFPGTELAFFLCSASRWLSQSDRVATNLENLDFSKHGKLREFCATAGKNCNERSVFVALEKPGKLGEFFFYFVATLSDFFRHWSAGIGCFSTGIRPYFMGSCCNELWGHTNEDDEDDNDDVQY